ncbi:MAG: carbohydrate porin [Candidatus Omnitrophica bacterium]|nr:carbohydrate porin [Candidatus Omnitrophota bacterium]
MKSYFSTQLKLSVLVVSLLVLFFIFGPIDICGADEAAIMAEIAELKARIAALEQKLTQQQQQMTKTEQKVSKIESIPEILEGINIGAGATFILQGTHNANGDNLLSKGDDVTDASYSIDVEIEKEFDDYGKAFIHLEAGGSEGVEDELKVFSNVNRDADNNENVRLTEAWYEHYLTTIPLTLTFGKIDATCFIDTNEYANDECGQFLGRIFRNSPTIEFADNAAGIRLGFEPLDSLDLEFVLMDADSDWEDMFDEMFVTTQLNIKPNLFNRSGNYRLIGWFNDRDHTKWLEQAKVTKASFGFGLSLDQELTDDLGTFFRYGWQDPKVFLTGEDYSLEHSWSAGLQLSGSIWNREEDVLGIAIGQAIPSDEYEEADAARNANSETHFEVYYSYKVNDHLTLSPDVQVILDPYGDDASVGDDTIAVFGMRGQVDF